MNVVRMDDIRSELAEWRVETEFSYDEAGEGWVLLTEPDSSGDFYTIHHGFEYNGTIYADANRLVVEPSNENKLNSADMTSMITNARIGWVVSNKSIPKNAKTFF